MADNIKIVGNILVTNTIPRYDGKDSSLIESQVVAGKFGGIDDYIEYFIYDAAKNQLQGDYGYKKYKLPSNQPLSPTSVPPPNTTGQIQTTNIGITSTLSNNTGSLYPIIEIDPIADLQNYGYSSGEFISVYNFFSNKISNSTERSLLIKEISTDRTEIRLISTTLDDDEIENTVFNIIDEINNSPYHIDYLLNYGDNKQFLIVNIALNKVSTGYEVLLKLYAPLPSGIEVLNRVWVVEEKVLPYSFNINLNKLILPPPPLKLKGPNFDVAIPNQGTVSTTYTSYLNAITGLQSLQSSSFNQIMNLMNTQSIHINVNYAVSESADFGNFVFLGSSYQRISNFYDKVKLIEDYNNEIARLTPFAANTSSIQTTINNYTSSIDTLVSQLDGYESYLYFESSSYTWPKSGSLKPYSLLSTGSSTALSWYNNQLAFAIDYDDNNVDNLKYAIPVFLRDDTANQPFITFLNMVGQYFDSIWIYIKAVTDINLANNNLNKGISKDLVYNQLQSLGIKVYNSQAGEDVNQFLIGANTGSSIFDNNFTVTGSYLNNIPRKDLLSELYKRIYHNLPLLLKTKGTKTGLDYLMTIFGIPNQTYYTVISGSVSKSFYSPTGSNFTSSILNVKEFGGSLKSKLIDGYNNDKSRIVHNTIATGSFTTGKMLSPMLGLQTFPTASNEFRENDMHYVDISFSPQTQIDTYISKSITSNNPSWNLDDYIGNPGQQYSSSYIDLDAQRKLYFETGVAGYPPFTGSALDYNGFIRLIEFFDNALFKMVGDFVPERTSLSTGVTINSPVLERNKVVYSVPNINTQSVATAEYPSSTISSIYNDYYTYLTGSKSEYYTGQFTGSGIDINYYFDYTNPNIYLGDWSVYNSQNSITKSIDNNKFLHSDFNVLLNNVSQSVKSTNRYKLERIFGTTSSLSSSAELQDSYLSLRTHNNSRYDGMKVTSLKYNVYTSSSYTGSDGRTIVNGDKSFGKYAAIDHTVRKLALFTQVKSNTYFPLKSDIALRYLVDEFGNLTELNQQNKHWEELQNTFKSGDSTVISLFDNQKFSDQKVTDGEKSIYNSGYILDPLFYYSSSDATASFQYSSLEGVNMFKFITYGGGGTISTGSLVSSSLTNGIYFYSSSATSQSDVPTEWPSTIKNIFNFGTDIQIYNEENCFSASFQYQPTYLDNIGGFSFGRFTVNTSGYYGFVFDNLYFNHSYKGTKFAINAYPQYKIYVSSSGQASAFTQTLYPEISESLIRPLNQLQQYFNNAVVSPFFYLSGSVIDFFLVRNVSGSINAASASFNFSESINAGGLFYSTLQGGLPVAYAPFSSSASTLTQFCLDEQFVSFYGNIFLPEGEGSNPSSSLYNTYGNVNYNFTVNPGDILKFILFNVTYEYEIASVTQTVGTSLCFTLSQPFSNAILTSLDKVSEVLFLRKSKDETNILLRYTKRPGQTSYGFAIPQKIAPDVLANIDTITKEVKQKLLAEQSALSGSF
jgi:hypothetical protein